MHAMTTHRLLAAMALTTLVTAACSGSGQGEPRPAPAPPPGVAAKPVAPPPPPPECADPVTTPAEATEALESAQPGVTICFGGNELLATDLLLTRSGTAEKPITLYGNQTTVRSVTVQAGHVAVDTFTTRYGQGIVLEGDGLTARDNTVFDAVENGISCEVCTGATLENNTVRRADGSGIIAEGDRNSLLGNDISESVMRQENDADGIRFFGTGLRIAGNTVHDISDDGYPDPPHTDCFQTYDNGRPPTVDVSIVDNMCTDVDHQCLIATAEESGIGGVVGRSRKIQFHQNRCEVEGSQALLIRWFPELDVRGNEIGGPHLERGISVLDGSINAAVFHNRFLGGAPFFEVDDSSRPGFLAGGNAGT